ncbi:hypothetical protein PPL_03796 [Heterostelium album PN500]|uniref:TLDc domain-containing protein n=1 Tax=Heterostelium pallidum (strain ATCC 26659 / Pp 5 / PN500) TaxID=670386 RepID=D3B6P4_HETP5|nr:hypothetical protein PPL_03796 [Heterostelium album PN500]EFA83014.1 hypothetical protein PPL_03796 [Heterostelium album PN500]|eukprot:XP_020435131.1 hypothetical protein PPL_03796 [Heterostelium album PN500]
MNFFQQLKKKISSDDNEVFNSTVSGFMGILPPPPGLSPIKPITTTDNSSSSSNNNKSTKSNKINTKSNLKQSTNNASSLASSTSSSKLSKRHHHHHHHNHNNRKAVPHCKLVPAQISDSLLSIATKFNMTEEDLMILNRLTSRYLYNGQIIMTCLNFNINTIIRPIVYSNYKAPPPLSLSSSSSNSSSKSGLDIELSTSSSSIGKSSNSIFLQMHQQLQPPSLNSSTSSTSTLSPISTNESDEYLQHQLLLQQQREQYKQLFESIKISFDILTTPTTTSTSTLSQQQQQQQNVNNQQQTPPTTTIDIITSYKLFLPALREKNDWYPCRLYENETKQDTAGNTSGNYSVDLSMSFNTTPMPLMKDSLLSFKNVIYFLEMDRMQIQLHGVIEVNKEFLTFAPISSNYSFNRIDIEISDILGWKFDSYHKDHLSLNIDVGAKTGSADQKNMITVFKIWIKYDDEEDEEDDSSDDESNNDIIKYFNGLTSNSKSDSRKESSMADRSRSEHDNNHHTDDEDEQDDDDDEDEEDFEEKIFIIDRTEIDIENYETILTGILGAPINSFYQQKTKTTNQTNDKSPDVNKSPTSTAKDIEHPLLAKTSYLLDKTLASTSPDKSNPSTALQLNANNQQQQQQQQQQTQTHPLHHLPGNYSTRLLSLRDIKPRETEIFKKEIHCIFNTRKVKGMLTLLPHWVIFQGDPKDEYVKKEGSVRFQLNYTMNQVLSCTMDSKSTTTIAASQQLKDSSGDLQFGMDSDSSSHQISDNEESTTTTTINNNNNNNNTTTTSSSSPPPSPNLFNSNNISNSITTTANNNTNNSNTNVNNISNVFITIQITPTIEKTIEFQCENEIAVSICNQLNIWMADVKINNTDELSGVGSSATMILDNILPLPPLIKPNSPSTFAKTLFRWNRTEYESDEETESDEYDELFIPKLFGVSTFITPDETLQVIPDLPVLYRLSDWVLLYKTERDGISMKTMYAKTYSQGACIILLKDFNNNVFGGFISESIKVSKSFYGSGECFLMKFKPTYKSYKWTRENRCFVLTEDNYISMGAGFNGKYGLWLDSEFNEGTSSRSETFDNDPLANEEDFKCVGMEIWGFV